jgi:hypothetical protein
MKAEQRKELETNALADRMGHLVQRMKTQPRRSTMYYVIGCIAVILAVAFGVRWYSLSREENSHRWGLLDNASQGFLNELATQGETNPGKAARFQTAWIRFWEFGIKRLAVDNGMGAMDKLAEARDTYKKLAEDCAGDPVWEPEAMYALAVIEETHAVQNLDALENAKKLYEDLAKKHKESARGKLADEWVKNYETPRGKQELTQFYQEMHTALNIPDLNALKKAFDFAKKKKDNPPPKSK